MAKANVDPTELRRFAQDLNRFNNELFTLVSGLKGKLGSLEATWRDQEQKKFSDAFEGTVKAITSFLDNSQEHVKFLAKKAAAVEDYLKQR